MKEEKNYSGEIKRVDPDILESVSGLNNLINTANETVIFFSVLVLIFLAILGACLGGMASHAVVGIAIGILGGVIFIAFMKVYSDYIILQYRIERDKISEAYRAAEYLKIQTEILNESRNKVTEQELYNNGLPKM